jgi:hypothetical protein
MSILDAIKNAKRESKNLADLAQLPQALIMQMAQRGEITKEEVPLIIGKKAELIEASARNAALAQSGQVQPTVMEQNMMKVAQSENPAPPPQQMPPQQMAPQQMAQQMPQQMPQMMAPQGAPLSPQMMAQAAPMSPEQVGIAQNPVPPMQLAGGGIIAFAPGGDVEEDDEYQEMLDESNQAAMNDRIYAMMAGLQGAGSSAGTGISSGSRGAERGMEDRGDLATRLRAQIMQKESGGRRYDKEGNLLTSSKGALGEMQVMPATARDPGFGITPARGNNPDELRRVGDEYASVLLNRYQDPRLAMIAYNMGPGATDKWLAAGADIKKLPKETQGYIRGVNLAQGGEVRHFFTGDYVDPFGAPDASYEMDALRVQEAAEARKLKEYEDKYNFLKQSAPEVAAKMKPPVTRKTAAEPARTAAAPAPTQAPQAPQGPVPMDNRFSNVQALQKNADEDAFNLMQYIKGREAKMDAAEKKDLALAGLAAGLGMLGGESQYWNVNVGKGGQAGVQQLASSQKTRAAQEAALGKLYGSAAQTDLMNKLRRDQLSQGKELKEEQMSNQMLKAKNDFIEKRLKAKGMDEMMLGTLRRQKAMGKLDPSKEAELNYYEKQIQDIENEANRMYSTPGSGSGFRLVGVR